MQKKIFFYLLWVLSSVSYAQVSNEPASDRIQKTDKIGAQFGYVNSFYHKISDHSLINIFLEHPISNKLSVKAQLEYYGKEFSYSYGYSYYTPGMFYLKDWNNLSADIGVISEITKRSYLGGGLSLEYFDIKRDYVSSGRAEDGFTTPKGYIYDQHYKIFRPGVFGLAGLNFKLNDYFTFFLEGRYKVIFIGSDFSDSYFNSINSFTGSVGFKVDIL